MNYATTGTISHGTLRTEDLLARFADTLEDCVTRNPEMPLARREQLTKLVWDSRELKDFDGDEGPELIVDLEDALQDFAPPGHLFGAHPGDGSDFGFWPSEQD